MRVLISLSHFFAVPSSLVEEPLRLFSSSTGYLPQETAFHEYLKFECFLWSIVLNEWLWDGVKSCKNRVLQCGSPTASQILPGAFSSVDSPQDHSLLWASICFWVGCCTDCRKISDPLWTFMGCSRTAASPWSGLQGLPNLEHLLPLLLHWP